MVLARNNREALGLEHVATQFVNVENDHLICALAHLSFLVEHETAAESINLVEVGD